MSVTTQEFLQRVWPEEGYYCIMTLVGGKPHKHSMCSTIEEATARALALAETNDVYFACLTYKEQQVWNPTKNKGEGGWSWRTQDNTKQSKTFFADLDVGEGKGFADQAMALDGLYQFLSETGLPVPSYNSSGYGIHVFWNLDTPLEATEWYSWAQKLKRIFEHHQFHVDPSRVEDRSSVLRVPGTFNHKRGDAVPVENWNLVDPIPKEAFLEALSAAFIRAGLDERSIPTRSSNAADKEYVPGDLNKTSYVAPSFKAVLKACPSILWMARNPAEVTEPEWYAAMQTIRLTEEGVEGVHAFSKGHPGYSEAEVDTKIGQLETKGIGPTSCYTMHSRLDSGRKHLCESCPRWVPDEADKRYPLVLARQKDAAPAPEILTLTNEGVEVKTKIVEPPYGFARLKTGGLSHTSIKPDKDGKDAEFFVQFYDHDLYPKSIVRVADEIPSVEWHAELPFDRPSVDFLMPMNAPYREDTLVDALTKQGIIVTKENLKLMMQYMIGYMQQLQKYAADLKAYNHLGWTDRPKIDEAPKGFLLPGRLITPTGEKKSPLSPATAPFAPLITTEGSYETQRKLLDFYNRPEYVAHQFIIMASLAAPLFHMTGHEGLIVNAYGETGVSKSSSMRLGAGFWGNPQALPLSGAKKGITPFARMRHLDISSTLPVFMDEITLMSDADVQEMALAVTQNGRIEGKMDGEIRIKTGDMKHTIMITTSNSSLHDKLSRNNQSGSAGSMRVMEVEILKQHVHTPHEAEDMFFEMTRNFGWIGPRFIEYCAVNYIDVFKRVRAKSAELKGIAEMDGSERFWFSGAASAIVACEIALSLDLVPYEPRPIQNWFLNVQLPYMRHTIGSAYVAKVDSLTNFIEAIGPNLIICETGTHRSFRIIHEPRGGEIKGRYEVNNKTLYVSKQAFKDYCSQRGLPLSSLTEYLFKENIFIGDKRGSRNILGHGMEAYEHAMTPTWKINMAHEALSGQLREIDGKVNTNVVLLKEAK